MAPPPIRKPTRAQQRATSSAAGVQRLPPDRNKFINVSEVLQAAIKAHNSASQNLDRPDRQYIEFPYDAGSRERNRKALKIVEQHLEKVLSFVENGKEKSYYGTYTFSELSPRLREAAVNAVTNDPDMQVFTQGENNWMIKTLIDQKMASKLRTIRGKAKRSNKGIKHVPSGLSHDECDDQEYFEQSEKDVHVSNAQKVNVTDKQERDSRRNDGGHWGTEQLLEDHRRSEEAAHRAQIAFEAATEESIDKYPSTENEHLQIIPHATDEHIIHRSDYTVSAGSSLHCKSHKSNALPPKTQQTQKSLSRGKSGDKCAIESAFDLPRASSRDATLVSKEKDSEKRLTSIDEQIAALMKEREETVENMHSASKNVKASSINIPTARSRLQARKEARRAPACDAFDSELQAQGTTQKRTREVSHHVRNVRGKRR